MKIGFYAPLKSPNHPIPSGDRAMARLLSKALTDSGHEVEMLSELRSWEGNGSQQAQDEIMASAQKEVERLTEYYQTHQPPALIFVYHVYHKAPDWIGVELANNLQIPYLIVEVSFAPKQHNGRWHSGHQQTEKCIKRAQTIIALNPVDIECLKPLLKSSQIIELLRPFLDLSLTPPANASALRQQFAERYQLDTNRVWLITVAMMRAGDKSTSYRQLAKTLCQIDADLWQWIAIGAGENSEQVESFFQPVADNCFFIGELGLDAIHQWLSISDIFTWPSVNEAYCLSLLEALAAGLPTVAQNYGGVPSIVEHDRTGYVTDPDQQDAFTRSLVGLIGDGERRKQMAIEATKKFSAEHSYGMAMGKINAICNNTRLV